MGDWMISKKRYWGLALPILTCDEHCGWFDVVGGREELKARAVEGWEEFEGTREPNTPHRPYVDMVKISCEKCGGTGLPHPRRRQPWLDAGIVPYSTIGYNTRPGPSGPSGSRRTSSPRASPASSATGSTPCWP